MSCLRKLPRELPGVAEAVRLTHRHMFNQSAKEFNWDADRCRAWIEPDGRPIITCPGDACDIAVPGHERVRPGMGAEFSDHNTDQPVQQIGHVVALAALHSVVDAAL
jgi:hypothetical protein